MTPRSFLWVSVFLFVQPAFSQNKGGTTPPAPPVGGTPPSTIAAPTRTTIPPATTQPAPVEMPTPIYLSGRVVVEDGSPLPGPVTIERVCNGNPRAVGYTDPSGNFGVELNDTTGVFQDASEAPLHQFPGGPQGSGSGSSSTSNPSAMGGGGGVSSQERMLMNCDLRARLAGYRSQSVFLAGRRPLDNPNVGTILLHREGRDEGTTVSTSTLQAPKKARQAFEKGVQFSKKNKVDESRASYQKAVDLYPAYAAAWCALGEIQASRGEPGAARESFGKAVKADPKFVNPYLQLSLIELSAKNWQKVADETDVALKLDSFDYPQAFLYNAIANYNLQKLDAAEKSIRQAERLDTRHSFPQVAHLYGAILIQRKDYAGAAEHYRAYLQLAPNANDAASVRSQLVQMEQLSAKKQ